MELTHRQLMTTHYHLTEPYRGTMEWKGYKPLLKAHQTKLLAMKTPVKDTKFIPCNITAWDGWNKKRALTAGYVEVDGQWGWYKESYELN